MLSSRLEMNRFFWDTLGHAAKVFPLRPPVLPPLADSLHIMGSRRLGGAERFFARLVLAMAEAGHAAVPVVPSDAPVSQLLGDLRKVHLPLRNPWDLFSMAQLGHLASRSKARVIQTYLGRASRLTRHLPKGVVHVARIGGYYKIPGYYDHAHAWVVNTRGLADYLMAQGLPATKIHVIGNFAEVFTPDAALASCRRKALGLKEEDFVVACLARLVEKKGIEDLLLAFALLKKSGKRQAALLLAGDGPMRQDAERLSQELGLSERVHFLGWQENPQQVLALADLLVCPSRIEPLGNVILEAWAAKVPVLATASEGPRELIEDGRTGILVPVADAPALAQALEKCALCPEAERKSLAEAGHKKLLESHGKESVVRAYLDLYARLLGEGS